MAWMLLMVLLCFGLGGGIVWELEWGKWNGLKNGNWGKQTGTGHEHTLMHPAGSEDGSGDLGIVGAD